MTVPVAILIAVVGVTPEQYGAVRDDGLDDTQAIQAACDVAGGTGDTVCLSPGVYDVASVNLPMGVRLNGRGGTLKMLADQHKFCRILTTQYTAGPCEVPIVIERVVFDMSRAQQGPYVGYEKEHQSGVFVAGHVDHQCRIVVRDCTFRESAGDGVSVHAYAQARIENCRFDEIFRGSIVQGGPNTDVVIDGFRGSGILHVPHIDHEPDSDVGYAHLSVCDAKSDDGLRIDLGLKNDSMCILEDCDITEPNLIGSASLDGGKFIARDCRFRVRGDKNIWIRRLRDATFQGCTFTATTDGHAAEVYHNYDDQCVQFVGCRFDAAEGVNAVGLDVNPATPTTNCTVVVKDCEFDSSLATGIHLDRCGRIEVQGGRFQCPKMIHAIQTNPPGVHSVHLALRCVHIDCDEMGTFINYYSDPSYSHMSSLEITDCTMRDDTVPIVYRPTIDQLVTIPTRTPLH